VSPEIDWIGVADIAELQTFIDEHWRRGHVLARDAELLRWQYRHPRQPDALSVLGAWEDGVLAGVLGLVQVDFALAGERGPGGWLALWQATPAARERRVGLALLLEALRLPWRALGCLGMNEQAATIYAGLRFELVPRLPRWVRPLSRDPLEQLVPGAARWPVQPVTQRGDDGSFDDARAAGWDETWEARFAPRLAGTWRDAAYLRVRYVEHPRFDYDVRIGADGRSLLVYRVEQIAGRDERVVRVLECLGDAEALAAAMLDEHGDCAFADFYCTHPEVAKPLEAVGFVPESELPAPVPERFQPLVRDSRGLNGAFRIPGVRAPLYATKSDGDQDRPS
jgi:hypothetical protein